jgi:Zn-dependent peptidase ImmA (M78 family)
MDFMSDEELKGLMAHELGHLVLHRLANEDDYDNKEKHELMEQQASIFAGYFLFPRQSFFNEFHSFRIDALIVLKKRWKISMGAIVMMAKNLDFITENNVIAFYRRLSIKGYSRKKEPLDDKIPVEPIKLFSEAMQLLAVNKINLQRIIDETLLSADDFYFITDIVPMINKEKNVKILQFRKTNY